MLFFSEDSLDSQPVFSVYGDDCTVGSVGPCIPGYLRPTHGKPAVPLHDYKLFCCAFRGSSAEILLLSNNIQFCLQSQHQVI